MRKLRFHVGFSWVLLWFAWGCAAAAPRTEEVNFPSQEAGITLRAYWTPPPAGRALAPAVVALHGCAGLPSDRSALDYARNRYIRILHDAGLGVLYVDSFGPRGQTSICEQKPTERTLTEVNRRLDVLAALQWLATQSAIDAKRLAVVGWSHGGQTVLVSADRSADVVATAAVKPAALVAFYPGCNLMERQFTYTAVAPLLVMSGELDNWTPALPCKRFTDRLKGEGQPVGYVQFEGSYHAFDSSAPVTERSNVGGTKSGKAMVGGNPVARIASAQELLRFLGVRLAFTPDMALLDESVHAGPLPAATDFAALSDADRVPASGAGRALYREWLEKPFPRAVAVSSKGALARDYGRTAMDAAIKNCEKLNNPCSLYAVDDRVVWTDK
ncbi:MAG: hypothetical protein RL392_304 [Pseudomonadota bacterium]|jgi:dienelactone hydrolase